MTDTMFDMLRAPWPTVVPQCWGCVRPAQKTLVVKYDDGTAMLHWCGAESCVPTGKNPVDTATPS